jgi:diguanylate cyclase (GGDEF)-like protein
VVRTQEVGDDDDRRFRRALEEVLEDVGEGLSPHSAGRAVSVLDPGIEQWFRRRDKARDAKNSELNGVIVMLGKALKSIQGDDADFLDGLDNSLERLKSAADSVQVRHVSARLQALVDGTAEQATAERKARDKRIQGLSQMVRGLHEQLDQAKVQLQEDALTGLYNRRSFDDRLEAELEKCRLAPYKFSLIMIDLDKFKLVNDKYGHVGGDRVLQAAAKVIQTVVLRRNDFCARYGGEEMAIILADCNVAMGQKVAEAVRIRLSREEINTGTGMHTQTASFGVAEGCDEDEAADVIERADGALYVAKEKGRNRVLVAGHGDASRIRLPRCQQKRHGRR